MKRWYIYKIVNPLGHIYIGRTCNPILRKRVHFKYRNKSSNKAIVESINLYGENAHLFEIIESFESEEDFANDKEVFWIRAYKSNRCRWPELNGMNFTDGGKSIKGHSQSEKSKLLMSIGHLGQKQSSTHINKIKEKLRKPVVKFSKQGKFIREYNSIQEAYLDLGGNKGGGNISDICKGKAKMCKGYTFRYKKDVVDENGIIVNQLF